MRILEALKAYQPTELSLMGATVYISIKFWHTVSTILMRIVGVFYFLFSVWFPFGFNLLSFESYIQCSNCCNDMQL